MKPILFLFSFIMASIFSANAATCYVAAAGSDTPPYDTWVKAAHSIQDAVNAAGAGGTVYVTNGTYTLAGQISIALGVMVRSFKNGAVDRDGTVINGNLAVRCFSLSHADAVLDGFTITNAYVVGNGGGVSISAGTLRNCLVTGNTATNGSGGGVYATGANSLITNCDIIANAAKNSGGAGTGGGGVKLATSAKLWNSRIMYNNSPQYWSAGGGIHCDGAAWVVNCSIISNKIGVDYNTGGSGSSVLYAWGGGGVWANSANAVTLRNCLIVGNGRGNADRGTGIGTDGGSATIENCTILRNIGSGIGVNNPGTYRVLNTISFYNTGSAMTPGSGGTLIASNCMATTTNSITAGSGNITVSPAFMQYLGGDYRLVPWSPGVDAGIVQLWMIDASDLAGQPRLSTNAFVDIGAYETAAGEPAYTYYVARNGQTPVSPYTNGWASAASNIQDVVDVASDGSTILVTNGIYTLTNQVSVVYVTIRSFKNGAVDRDGTIIKGGYPASTNRCFTLSHVSALVEGFTITNGYVSGANGGGVYITNGTLRNCLVTWNTCTNGSAGGGGIYATGANSLITNCDVIANVAGWSGDASFGAGGGGVYLVSSASLLNSRIIYNRSPHYYTGGGGINCNGGSLVANCSIISNTTLDGWGGGGVWMNGNNNTLRNCLIMGSNDGRTHFGDGVGAAEGIVNYLDNCTIVGNSGQGIGARNATGTGYRIANTISYYNTGEAMYAGPAGTIVASNSCATATNYISVGSSGNITNNPAFENYAGGNYRLSRESPCLNSGMYLAWSFDGTDLDGGSRVDKFAGKVDMGCYEFHPRGLMFKVR
ncbi:MAG: right-handed parallel beta-helix repeat-containing protein [Kiritimatiellia bacterium]